MKKIIPLLGSVLLAGCSVGPQYSRPPVSMPVEYLEAVDNQSFAIQDDQFFEWWKRFNDPFLDQLLEETLQGNFDYLAAVERVCQLRAEYWVQTSQLFPDLESDFLASRYRTSTSFDNATPTPVISPIRDFFQAGFVALWEVDLFGRIRHLADAAHDRWEASADDARAVKIVVLSEVARLYTIICSYQEQVDLASERVTLDEELLDLAIARFNAGLANAQEVETARAQLEGDQARFHLVEIGFKLNMYAMGVLLGRHPESLVEDFKVKRAIPQAVGKVPVGLPSDLLRRRPDIRSAERNLAAATELVGAAVAELFPQVSLTGSSSSFAANPLQGANVGFTSDKFSKLFRDASRIWGIGAFVTFPVFDFGNRIAAVNVQDSLKQQAYYNYQKVVLEALQEVEQALSAYFNNEKRVQEYTREEESLYRIYALVLDQFQAGLVDYSEVIRAKENWLLALNNLTETKEALATDLIALYKALGGDW